MSWGKVETCKAIVCLAAIIFYILGKWVVSFDPPIDPLLILEMQKLVLACTAWKRQQGAVTNAEMVCAQRPGAC
jgi:hypothetical protein